MTVIMSIINMANLRKKKKAKGVKNVAAAGTIAYQSSFNKKNYEALRFHD